MSGNPNFLKRMRQSSSMSDVDSVEKPNNASPSSTLQMDTLMNQFATQTINDRGKKTSAPIRKRRTVSMDIIREPNARQMNLQMQKEEEARLVAEARERAAIKKAEKELRKLQRTVERMETGDSNMTATASASAPTAPRRKLVAKRTKALPKIDEDGNVSMTVTREPTKPRTARMKVEYVPSARMQERQAILDAAKAEKQQKDEEEARIAKEKSMKRSQAITFAKDEKRYVQSGVKDLDDLFKSMNMDMSGGKPKRAPKNKK